MTIYFSLLVALVGMVVYLLATNNAKAAELGRLSFACGLLAFLLTGIEKLVSVIPR